MNFAAMLHKIEGGNVTENEPMSRHTSFQIGGCADFFALPASVSALTALIRTAKEEGAAYTIIGAGSNLLVSDRGIRGLTVKIGKPFGELTADGCKISAGAGVSLARLASFAASLSLSGLEFASGIPGSVGGAVYMNAGAYGSEMREVTAAAHFTDGEGGTGVFSAAELGFDYRRSRFCEEDGLVILGAELLLTPGNREEITAKMRELNGRRADKQPLNLPSAGSAFKRPVGGYASRLIEDAGLKGASVGGAQVSLKHSGFIVNTGGATAEDVRALIAKVQRGVFEKFGVRLTPEIKLLGEY